VTSVLTWLDDPPADRGLRFAGDGGGDPWTFYSYEQMAYLARQAALRLWSFGVRPGDTVLVLCPTSPEFVAHYFGALIMGAVPAAAAPPPRMGDLTEYRRGLDHVVRLIAAKAVVTTPGSVSVLAPVARDVGGLLIDASAPAATRRADFDAPAIEDLSIIQLSSGSTGPRHGVRISLPAVQSNVAALHRWLEMTSRDRFPTWLPLSHDMGLVGALLNPVAAGADVWLMPPEDFIRSPIRWLRLFSDLAPTITAMPAFGLAHILRRVPSRKLEGLDFSSWRGLIIGAERIDHDIARRFVNLLEPFGFPPRALSPAYGMAEATLAVTGTSLAEVHPALTVDARSLSLGNAVKQVPARAGRPLPPAATTVVGCGTPLPRTEVTIVDGEGTPVGEDVVGEIVIRGQALAAAVLREAGAEQPIGATFATGDAGFLHQGRLYVLGRLGDSVKQLGRWLFAEDIERVAWSESPSPQRTVALLGDLGGHSMAVIAVQGALAAEEAEAIGKAVCGYAGNLRVTVMSVPVGWLLRTPSGKPMRRAMWAKFIANGGGANVLWRTPHADEVRFDNHKEEI
jgi:acyl-CoA synthetase (AMP-forming)/AMP-acid ligase II